MANFAQLNEENVVIRVVVINNNDIIGENNKEEEDLGIKICQNIFGKDTIWKQTSYNKNFRGNFAGIGYTYMTGVQTLGVGATDIFIEQQPYPSWSIDTINAKWCPPIQEPGENLSEEEKIGIEYVWDEDEYQSDSNIPKTSGWKLIKY